jgi:hypothetical protein
MYVLARGMFLPYLMWCGMGLSLFLIILGVDQIMQIPRWRRERRSSPDHLHGLLTFMNEAGQATDEADLQTHRPLLGEQTRGGDPPPVVLREVRSTPVMWSIWANDFQELPEKIKVEMWVYLQQHGVDPTRLRGFTFDATNSGIWVEYVVVDANNIAALDLHGGGQVIGPRKISEWIVLQDIKGKDRPMFLEWMTPSVNPPPELGEPGNPNHPRVMLKDSEWGT